MTKAEFIKALTPGPDDARIVIADYVGEDLMIADVIYFAKEKLFWVRTSDMVGDDEGWPEEGDECDVSYCGAPTEIIEGEVLPLPTPTLKGRQRAA